MRGLPSLKCLNLIRVGDAAREFTQRPTKLVGNGTRGHTRHRDLMPRGNFPYSHGLYRLILGQGLWVQEK